MKNIVAFAASNSKKSINKQLVSYVSEQVTGFKIHILDLNDLDLPMYNPDLQNESGIPADATRFAAMIASCDGVILSLAEHNSHFSAAFKNLWDWASRVDKTFWADKPMLLMAASPGPRGGQNVLKNAQEMFPYFGGNIIADFSLPSFHDNFKEGQLLDRQLSEVLTQKVRLFQDAVDLPQLSL